ncbi:MAG: UbiA family prenyltransferase [Anaerolineales bacterium]|nr:UbiA family prenyltransferase [Anaerolineales bacterium]
MLPSLFLRNCRLHHPQHVVGSGHRREDETHSQEASYIQGSVTREEVFKLGIIVSVIGIGWALLVNPLYGVVVFAGLFFDVVVYSMWLKRRTCWRQVGGISGAMPILAGCVLAVGQIDIIGILLASAVLFWIPTHTLTFSLKFLTIIKRRACQLSHPRMEKPPPALQLRSPALSLHSQWVGHRFGSASQQACCAESCVERWPVLPSLSPPSSPVRPRQLQPFQVRVPCI